MEGYKALSDNDATQLQNWRYDTIIWVEKKHGLVVIFVFILENKLYKCFSLLPEWTNYRSTPIAVRIDSKTVQTHSGSIYKLKGGIEEDEAAEAGLFTENISYLFLIFKFLLVNQLLLYIDVISPTKSKMINFSIFNG